MGNGMKCNLPLLLLLSKSPTPLPLGSSINHVVKILGIIESPSPSLSLLLLNKYVINLSYWLIVPVVYVRYETGESINFRRIHIYKTLFYKLGRIVDGKRFQIKSILNQVDRATWSKVARTKKLVIASRKMGQNIRAGECVYGIGISILFWHDHEPLIYKIDANLSWLGWIHLIILLT